MKYMFAFDVILLLLSIYLFYSAIISKKNGVIAKTFVPEGRADKCRDNAGMVRFMIPRIIGFACITLVFGLESLLSDFNIFQFPQAVTIGLALLFLATWFWFSSELKKGYRQFYSQM